jgi:oligoribonuclease
VLSSVTPWRSASPLRGSTKPPCRRDSDRDTGRHEGPATRRLQRRHHAREQIDARVARPGVCRHGQFRIETDDRDVERHRRRLRESPLVRRSLPLMLVWMDLEMTGLDPTTDVIVEIATIVTDDELEITAVGTRSRHPLRRDPPRGMHPVVVDMHTRSGLLEKIRASEMDLAEAGRQTFEFIKQWAPEPRTVPLCGNSIGMDRRFLAAYLPEIEEWLHYRSVDVSSIKELVKRWYPTVDSSRPNKAGTHRALDDVMASIEELRYYRRTVFSAAPADAEKLSPTSTLDL